MEGYSVKRYQRGRLSQLAKLALRNVVENQIGRRTAAKKQILQSGSACEKYDKELNISILLSLEDNKLQGSCCSFSCLKTPLI